MLDRSKPRLWSRPLNLRQPHRVDNIDFGLAAHIERDSTDSAAVQVGGPCGTTADGDD